MQNKPPIIDDAFAQKGWNEMQILLDQEMPVERKRRWLPFFWLLFGLIAVAFFWNGYYKTSDIQQNTSFTDEHEIAENNVSFSKETIAKTTPITQEGIENDSPILPTNDFSKNQSITPTINSQKNTKAKNQNLKNIGSPTKISDFQISNHSFSFINHSINSGKVKLGTNLPLSSPTKHENAAEKEDLNLKILKGKEVLNLLPSPLKEINLINEMSSLMLKTTIVQIQEVRNISKHQFGLKLGVGHDFEKQTNIHFGSFWNRQIKGKWFLETGLHVHFLPKSKTLLNSNSENLGTIWMDNSSTEDEEDTVIFAGGNGTDLPDEEDTSGTSPETNTQVIENTLGQSTFDDFRNENRRYAIVLPIQVGYRFQPKWIFYGGLQVAYIFSKEKNSLVQSSFLNSTTYPQNGGFEFWTKAQIRYNPTPKIGFELGYNYSLSPANPNWEIEADNPYRHHFTDFSILYRF